jgi:hypothetical protein
MWQAWDGGTLNTMTKQSPAKATGAHISISGHISDIRAASTPPWSELHEISVKSLSDQIALVGWEFTRHRTSDEAYSRAAAMYKVKHGEDGWKMISMLTYDAEAYIPF